MRSRPRLAMSAVLGVVASSLFIASPAMADTATTTDGDYTYTISNGEASITAFAPAVGVTAITIPATLGSAPVTDIGGGAFASHGLTSVVLPDSVVHVGYAGFAHNALTSVDFGSGLQSLDYLAFGYNDLETLDLPDSLTTFGNGVFGHNPLSTVTIPANVTTIGNAIFDADPLVSVYFAGDAPVDFIPSDPSGGSFIYGDDTAAVARITIYYLATSTGFTPGTWNAYNSVPISPPALSTTPLAGAQVAVAYSTQLEATGNGLMTFSSTDLPTNGLSVSSAGLLTGTPIAAGTTTFTIVASNNANPADSRSYSLSVAPQAGTPAITSAALLDGEVGTAYDFTPTFTGSTTNVVFSLRNSTTLPPGLVLDSATGRVSGVPTVAGTSTIVLRLTNDIGFTEQSSTIEVVAAPVIPVIPVVSHITFTPGFVVGTRVADATVAVTASGLLVGSTYTLVLHSDPVILGQGIITSTGELNLIEQIPVDAPAGSHSLVLNITAADGTAISRTIWFNILSDGTIGAISTIGPIPPSLAATGFDATTPIGIGAFLLFAGALMVVRRRRLR